ncbi:YegP family protein [Dokdonella sp.]|uniref:YegP family protein n=1 Tax=Dokdonella sp. TaxID=2291710 RepID=UPI003C3F0A47
MSGHYEISSNDKGQFSFVLKAANGQVILRSQMYESRGAAQTGIASVQTNSPSDERYELSVASDGRPYFNLRAGNGQVIGTSQMYSSDDARATGIASVKTNGPGTDVREA